MAVSLSLFLRTYSMFLSVVAFVKITRLLLRDRPMLRSAEPGHSKHLTEPNPTPHHAPVPVPATNTAQSPRAFSEEREHGRRRRNSRL